MAKVSTFKIEGARELERLLLESLPAKLVRTTMLAGMRKSAKPMVGIAKAKVAFRSGALQQSIGIKSVRARGGVTQSQLKGESTFAAIEIGPLSGSSGAALHAWARYKAHYGQGVSILKGKKLSTGQLGRIRHGHLIEFGFTHRSGKKVPARPFLAPAFNGGFPLYRRSLIADTRKKILDTINRHNARSRLKR